MDYWMDGLRVVPSLLGLRFGKVGLMATDPSIISAGCVAFTCYPDGT